MDASSRCRQPPQPWTFAWGIVLALTAAFSAAAAQQPDGAALYARHCRSCHGADGVPSARMKALYSSLRALDSTFLATLSVDSIVTGLKNGLPQMKSYAGRLSDSEMTAVAKYVMTLGAPPRTPSP